MRLRVSRRAQRDIEQALSYTRTRYGDRQETIYANTIQRAFQDLLDHPLIGPIRADLAGQFRAYRAGHHIVFYRLEDDDLILVIAVLHERMDPARHLG